MTDNAEVGMSLRQNYLLHEYNAMRNEIIAHTRESAALTRFLLVSIAVAVAWLLNESGKLAPVPSFLGAWVPFFLNLWYSAYRHDLREAIFRLADQIKRIEKELGVADIAWESAPRRLVDGKRIKLFSRSNLIYASITPVSVLFAIWYSLAFSFGVNFGNMCSWCRV
jgi:hypothetical protein